MNIKRSEISKFIEKLGLLSYAEEDIVRIEIHLAQGWLVIHALRRDRSGDLVLDHFGPTTAKIYRDIIPDADVDQPPAHGPRA